MLERKNVIALVTGTICLSNLSCGSVIMGIFRDGEVGHAEYDN